MKATIRDRLLEFLAYKNIGQNRFAVSVGVSPGYVNNIVEGIKSGVLQKIKKTYPEISLDWLIMGEGDMLVDDDDNDDTSFTHGMIPVLEYDSCRDVDLVVNNKKTLLSYAGNSSKPQIPLLPDTDVYIIVQSDAMRPRFDPGDLVACKYVENGTAIVNGATYFLQVKGIGFVLRRLYDWGDAYELRSYNSMNYTPIKINKEDVYCMLSVLGSLRASR